MQPGLESHAFNHVFTALGTGLNTIGPYVARLHIKLHIAMRTNHPEFGAPAHRWLRDEGRHQENFERQKDPT